MSVWPNALLSHLASPVPVPSYFCSFTLMFSIFLLNLLSFFFLSKLMGFFNLTFIFKGNFSSLLGMKNQHPLLKVRGKIQIK
jgi:hypothetical protein